MKKKSRILFVAAIVFVFLTSNCVAKSLSNTSVPASVTSTPVTSPTFTPKPTRDAGTVGSDEALSNGKDDGNDLNGFMWQGKWTPGLPTFETDLLASPKLVEGNVEFYSPGIMEATARYRGFGDYQQYVGTVSLMFAGDIGSKVWLKRPGHDWEGAFLVVDCARRNDLYGVIVYNGEVAEVDFQTALRWGMVTMGYNTDQYVKNGNYSVVDYAIPGVLVSKVDPTMLTGNEQPANLMDFFLDRVHYQQINDWRTMEYLGGTTWRLYDKNSSQTITLDPQNPK